MFIHHFWAKSATTVWALSSPLPTIWLWSSGLTVLWLVEVSTPSSRALWHQAQVRLLGSKSRAILASASLIISFLKHHAYLYHFSYCKKWLNNNSIRTKMWDRQTLKKIQAAAPILLTTCCQVEWTAPQTTWTSWLRSLTWTVWVMMVTACTWTTHTADPRFPITMWSSVFLSTLVATQER